MIMMSMTDERLKAFSKRIDGYIDVLDAGMVENCRIMTGLRQIMEEINNANTE